MYPHIRDHILQYTARVTAILTHVHPQDRPQQYIKVWLAHHAFYVFDDKQVEYCPSLDTLLLWLWSAKQLTLATKRGFETFVDFAERVRDRLRISPLALSVLKIKGQLVADLASSFPAAKIRRLSPVVDELAQLDRRFTTLESVIGSVTAIHIWYNHPQTSYQDNATKQRMRMESFAPYVYRMQQQWASCLQLVVHLQVIAAVPLCDVRRQLVIFQCLQRSPKPFNIQLWGDWSIETTAFSQLELLLARGVSVDKAFLNRLTHKITHPFRFTRKVEYYRAPLNCILQEDEDGDVTRVFDNGSPFVRTIKGVEYIIDQDLPSPQSSI